ncbi:hypothetical protein BDV93DRAFT_364182 [Ceratobasidium sp. AG-I]|nr:hypothetical protein BDV93DRAFT_364182 [Ceratobasidium sp. AG-I]
MSDIGEIINSPSPSVSTLYEIPLESLPEKSAHSSGISVLHYSPDLNRQKSGDDITRTHGELPVLSSAKPPSVENQGRFSHYLFDSQTSHQTWDYAREVLIIVMMLVVFMWAALPLYWGSLAPGPNHAPSLKAWVVDFDGGPMGSFVTESVMNSTKTGTKWHLNWEVRAASEFGSLSELARQILQEKAWAAIVINPRSSSSLAIARAMGHEYYDPATAVTLYIEQARNENAVGQLVSPISTQLLDNTLRQFNTIDIAAYIRSVRNNPDAIATSLEAPTALAGAWWGTINLRPWNSAVATPMTVVGQIYLTVFTFILTMATFQARRKFESKLTYTSLVSLRIAFPLVAYLPLSLSYALLSLPFHAPFGSKYTYGAGFFVYLAYIYMDMCALGLACEAAMSILKPQFMTFFLVSWLIVNISTPIEPHEMQSWWYKYGYGMPFYNHATAVRTILFSTKNVLGRNAGVLVAWMGLSIITISALTWTRRRSIVRKERRRTETYGLEKTEVIWSSEHV